MVALGDTPAWTGQMEEHTPALLELRFTGTELDPNVDYRYEPLERRAETAAQWKRSARLQFSLRSFSDLDGDGQIDEPGHGHEIHQPRPRG